MNIYDHAIKQLEKYRSIPSAKKVYEKAVENLQEQKDIANNLSELGIE